MVLFAICVANQAIIIDVGSCSFETGIGVDEEIDSTLLGVGC